MLNTEEDCEALQRAFGVLKPVCDDVVKSVTKSNAQALRNLLQNVPRPALQKLQSYVLFPIEGNLSVEQTVSNEIKRYLVESLRELLSLTRTTSFDTFLRLYRLLFLQITDFRNCQHASAKSESLSPTTKLADVSEELKMSVLQCVIVLFSTATSEVLDRFYDSKFYPTIAWGILLCTKIVHHEKMIKLRAEALNCILHQSQCHDEADVTDIVFRDKVRNALMHMLPGIVSTSAFAVRNPIENHRIVQMAIRVWSRIVVLVMVDDEEQNYNNAFHVGKHFVALDQLMLDKNKLRNGKRSLAEISEDPQKVSDNSVTSKIKELRNMAALNLAEISKVMVSTEQHNHWHVRKELAVAVDQILTNCSKIMEPSISSLMECLIVLSQDETENVSNYSITALKKFSEKYESDSEKSFLESIEESFFSFLTRFPRVVLSTGAATQMGLLNGYLHLFGSQLPLVLSSKTHLHRLMFCLINSVQFDVSDISLLSGPSLRDMDDDNAYGNVLWKKMILSQDDQVLNQLHQICTALRNNADLSVICHTLMDLLDEYQQYVNELLLILNSLLTSGCDESMTKYKSLMKELLDFYMDLPVWPASDLLIETKSSLRSDQIRVVQLCLAIEGIGRIAVVVGKEIFDPWLLQCLYSILEAAGSPLEVISLAGLDAVRNIAKVCANNDLTTLICNNTDYLTHHITKRMRHYHRHPGLLAVLSVIMHYSSKEVLPSLHEIISDVLQQSYDTFQMNNMYAYLRTFFTFIASIRRWEVEVECTEKLDKKSELLSDEKTPLEQLLDYKMSKTVAETLDTDSESDEEKTLEERFSELKKSCNNEIIGENDETLELEKVNDEKKKVVPLHIQLVVDILQRSLHFLPSKDCTQRILVLQVLNEGVLLLKTCPDQLLPVVHSIWSPFVNRFQQESNEPLAMQRAFQLLQSLAATSRDFIRVRTLRDVVPSVCKVLKSTAAESILKDTKSAYRLTQQYKLQKCLLEGLGQLAVDIEVSECNMDEILKAATPYLNSLQPQPLQDACILLFKTVTTISFDFVWLHLISVWSPMSLIKSDCPFLLTVQLPVSTDSEYKKNVQILLQFCDSFQMTT